jgi:glutamyl-tRNA synthetase
MEYPRLGYVPDAMVNYLALLGWSPGTNQELLSRDELVAQFALEGISGGNAVFDQEKLDWFNQQYIGRMPASALLPLVEPWLRESGLWDDAFEGGRREWLLALIDLLKPRIRRLGQFVEEAAPFLRSAVEFDAAAVSKHLAKPELAEPVTALASALEGVEPFERQAIEAILRGLAEARGLKAAALIHASRVAVTGRAASPGLFEVMELLGRAAVVAQLRAALPLVATSS